MAVYKTSVGKIGPVLPFPDQPARFTQEQKRTPAILEELVQPGLGYTILLLTSLVAMQLKLITSVVPAPAAGGGFEAAQVVRDGVEVHRWLTSVRSATRGS